MIGYEDLLRKMADAISIGDSEAGIKAVKLCLEKGVDVKEILMRILTVWAEFSEFFKRPDRSETDEKEIIKTIGKAYPLSYSILFFLDKEISEVTKPIGCVVVGCIKEEGHFLVKDIMALLFKASGYKVVYKFGGGGETPSTIVKLIKSANADALILSVSQPATLPMINKTMEALKREGLRDKIFVIVGGSPITEEISQKLECNAFIDQPLKAVKAVEYFIQSKEKR